MRSFEELKSNQCFTVKELIKKLKEYPPETRVHSLGADFGGYDVSEQPYVGLEYKEGYILLSHFEKEADDGLGHTIDSEQYKEFDLN